jgi:hypothetical protein
MGSLLGLCTFIDKEDYEGLVKRLNEDLTDPSLPEALRKQCRIMNESTKEVSWE